MTLSSKNVDARTADSFADEWSRFDQSELSEEELQRMFERYFRIFPWDRLPDDARGFDMGCGTGRWAKFVAERVGHLTLVDVSQKTLDVARRNLSGLDNVDFVQATANDSPLPSASQDFGYSLGVLHHIPDTRKALASCVQLLKPGSPFLIYLYYRFDNRPKWFAAIWRISEMGRALICRLPSRAKHLVTDTIAALVYWPLARMGRLASRLGLNAQNMPLYEYRNSSFYTMRTDSRDRFGTPLEQRFTRDEIHSMMADAGLRDVEFSDAPPFWCSVGYKSGRETLD